MEYEESVLSSGRWHIFLGGMERLRISLWLSVLGGMERLHISLWLSVECELQVTLLLQNKKNSSIPSKENCVSSRPLYCSHCLLSASPHQTSGSWQIIRLKNKTGVGETLMHGQSNEECQSHASCIFSNDKNGIIYQQVTKSKHS